MQQQKRTYSQLRWLLNKPSIVIKNTNVCNLSCWFCSTCGKETMPVEKVKEIAKKYNNHSAIIIGGEPMTLPPSYYLDILNSGVEFSMQSNMTMYGPEWNEVLTHKNFTGLSVSGDKFTEFHVFKGMYNQIASVVGYKPPVLVVMDGPFVSSRAKALSWAYLAYENEFPVKINYLLPTGFAKGQENKLLKISEAFSIYNDVFDYWKEKKMMFEVQPLQDIYKYVIGKGGAICPFICDCIRRDAMIDIEPDGSEYPCPPLGDLRKTKKDIRVEIDTHCQICDHFDLCKGCSMRNWIVDYREDTEYCYQATRLFNKIKQLAKEERKCS